MLGRRLVAQVGHPLRAGARHRLIRRDADTTQPGAVVERLEDAGERDRAAVRVRDDAITLERLERPIAVHLWNHEWTAVDQAVGGRLVHADGTGGGGVRHQLPAGGRADREQAEVEVAGAE